MTDPIIIGLGNPYRGDDGAGWAVIDALEGRSGKIKLRKIQGDIAELLDIFANHSPVYVIDACCMDAPTGIWKRIDARQPLPDLDKAQTSTHGLSLNQAIQLAKSLNQLPTKLIIYAINSDRYNVSSGLSAPVAQTIGIVAQHILDEEEFCHART
jgi:hydrogenase maturation protease